MSQAEFKIGDRVEVLIDPVFGNAFQKGWYGNVVGIEEGPVYVVEFEIHEPGSPFEFLGSALQHVSYSEEFKIGDRVKRVFEDHEDHGTIRSAHQGGGMYWVRWDAGESTFSSDLQPLVDEVWPTQPEHASGRFTVKDSGTRAEYASGMVRDTEEGKARFDLLVPLDVPYHEQMLTRFAQHMTLGAEKYDPRNWEKAKGEEELARYKSSAFRHLIQWLTDERDEDHAAGVMFNLMAAETVRSKMQKEGHAE